MVSSVFFTTFVFLALFGNQLTSGQLTIPNRELGFVYKPLEACASSKVTLGFYIDNTCDESQAAFPTILKVADHFGPKNLTLVSHLFSLPFHRNSHTIAKGAHVIDAFSKGAATYGWFKVIYDHLDQLTTAGSTNLNDGQVMDILAPLAEKVSGIPPSQFRSQVAERAVDLSARLGWKYGCTRGVYGTPTFMLNDVVVPADPTWTKDQWIQTIQALL